MTLFFQSVLCGAKDGVADVNTLSTFSCSQDFSSYHRLKAIHVLWPLTIFLLARNSINKTSTFAACIPIVIYIYVYCSLATHHRFFLKYPWFTTSQQFALFANRVPQKPWLIIGFPFVFVFGDSPDPILLVISCCSLLYPKNLYVCIYIYTYTVYVNVYMIIYVCIPITWLYIRAVWWQFNSLFWDSGQTDIHVHTHVYIYIYIYVCISYFGYFGFPYFRPTSTPIGSTTAGAAAI